MKADPFKAYKIPGSAKKVVTFLRSTPSAWPEFPIEKDGAVVAGAQGSHVFTHYVAHPKGPTFMVLIEKLFGTEVTTRTWTFARPTVRNLNISSRGARSQRPTGSKTGRQGNPR